MSNRVVEAASRQPYAQAQPMASHARSLSVHPLQGRIDASQRQKQQGAQLARLQSHSNDAKHMVVQRKKDEDERGDGQRRRQRATGTIGKLGTNLKPGLHNHIFNAKPVGGGELDSAHPSGLHAYTDGALPGTVVAVARRGSAGGIHTLTWRAADGEVNKASTMFPKWMSAPHVTTMIALKYPDVRQEAVEGPLYAEDTKTYIQRGQDIYSRITKSGDTVYPQ